MSTTVLFADLTGSTRVFEVLGNAQATDTVTQITDWVGKTCEAHAARVIKKLGDGVLAAFPDGIKAVAAAQELQRSHAKRLQSQPPDLHMDLQIGVASGEVLEVSGDTYGDAVNVASRLCGMAGSRQIWVTASVIEQLGENEVRHRNLGAIAIRGRRDALVVHRIDWQEDGSEMLTQPSPLRLSSDASDSNFGQIELAWLDVKSMFLVNQLPITLGRVDDADFVVSDPRVSRMHARLEQRNGRCVLVDVSTYGTWVRFHGAEDAGSEIALRREECVLHGSGEIGLGAPLSDFTSPTISFRMSGGNLVLAHRNPLA